MKSNAERFFSRLFREVIEISGRLQDHLHAKPFFLAALLIFTIAQAFVHFQPFSENPVRDDDAYGYMVKAREISSNCFFQDCQALTDLKPQVTTVAEDPDIAEVRNRIYHRLFVVYHPLHSAMMVLLTNFGFSLEDAYNGLYDLIKVLLPLSIAYWLLATWGAGTAAIALLLLAPVLFVSPGLHVVAMHTFALALAFFQWAEIASRTRRVDYLFVPLIIGMILMHPLGKLLALCSLIFYILEEGWPLKKRSQIVAGAGIIVLALSFLLPTFISNPELNFDPLAFYPGRWDYFGALRQALAQCWAIIVEWSATFSSATFIFGLALLGVLVQPKRRMFKIVGQFVVLFGLTIASILYVVPWYDSLSFVRVWPILVLFVTAGFAAGLNAALGYLHRLIRSLSGKQFGSQVLPAKLNVSAPGWKLFISLVISFGLFATLANYFSFHVSNYIATLRASPDRGLLISRDQVSFLLNLAEKHPPATVLYMDEFAIEFYMTYGALDLGAIYYPALRNASELSYWLEQKEETLAFVVNRNPVFSMSTTLDGGFALSGDADMRILGLNQSVQQIQILVAGDELPAELRTSTDGIEYSVVEIPPGQGWVSLPAGGDKLILEAASGNQVDVLGVRLRNDSQTLWPWDQGVSISYEDASGLHQLDLDSTKIISPLRYHLSVLDDTGFFILAAIDPK